MWFDDRPADCRQGDDRNLPTCHVLLVRQRQIARHHYIESASLCGCQEVPVFQTGPAKIGSREGFVMAKMWPEIVRYIFVKNDFQGCN